MQRIKICKDVQGCMKIVKCAYPNYKAFLSLRKRRRPEDLHFRQLPSWYCRRLPAQVTRLKSFEPPWQIEPNSGRFLNSSICCSTSCNSSAPSFSVCLRYSLNEHTDTDEWSFRACRIGRIIMPRNHTFRHCSAGAGRESSGREEFGLAVGMRKLL